MILPSGRRGIYGVVEKGPGVCVVPADADADAVTLVRQYRYTIDAETWELPAGSLHAGEGVAAAARRELRELRRMVRQDRIRCGITLATLALYFEPPASRSHA